MLMSGARRNARCCCSSMIEKADPAGFSQRHAQTMIMCIEASSWHSDFGEADYKIFRQCFKTASLLLEARPIRILDLRLNAVGTFRKLEVEFEGKELPEVAACERRMLRLRMKTSFVEHACGLGADLSLVELLLRHKAIPTKGAERNIHDLWDELGRFDEDDTLSERCRANRDLLSEANKAVELAGSRVRVQGLKKQPQHNGQTGKLCPWFAGSGRFAVRLDEGGVLSLSKHHYDRGRRRSGGRGGGGGSFAKRPSAADHQVRQHLAVPRVAAAASRRAMGTT